MSSSLSTDMLWKHQRSQDIAAGAIRTLAAVASISWWKVAESSFFDNVQRLGYPVFFALITLWSMHCQEYTYRKQRTPVFAILRVLVPLLPSHRSPKFMLSRLDVQPNTGSWVAQYITEPLRIGVGSYVLMLVFPISGLPLHIALPAHIFNIFAIHNTEAVCNSQLINSSVYKGRIASVFSIIDAFTDQIVVWVTDTAHQHQVVNEPLDQCKTVVCFMYIMIGIILPFLYYIKLAPGVVVLSARENIVDKNIIKLATFFVEPHRHMLRAADVSNENMPVWWERLLFSHMGIAVLWLLATIVK